MSAKKCCGGNCCQAEPVSENGDLLFDEAAARERANDDLSKERATVDCLAEYSKEPYARIYDIEADCGALRAENIQLHREIDRLEENTARLINRANEIAAERDGLMAEVLRLRELFNHVTDSLKKIGSRG